MRASLLLIQSGYLLQILVGQFRELERLAVLSCYLLLGYVGNAVEPCHKIAVELPYKRSVHLLRLDGILYCMNDRTKAVLQFVFRFER